MSGEATGAIMVGYDRRDTWGALQRRPSFTIYLIHFGTPVLARESATLDAEAEVQNPWRFPASMICRPDPVDFAYDLAYFIAAQTAVSRDDPKLATDLTDWPEDPRDQNGFERREALHDAVSATVATQPRVRLQVVRFDGEHLLGSACVNTLRKIGYQVEVFEGPADLDA